MQRKDDQDEKSEIKCTKLLFQKCIYLGIRSTSGLTDKSWIILDNYVKEYSGSVVEQSLPPSWTSVYVCKHVNSFSGGFCTKLWRRITSVNHTPALCWMLTCYRLCCTATDQTSFWRTSTSADIFWSVREVRENVLSQSNASISSCEVTQSLFLLRKPVWSFLVDLWRKIDFLSWTTQCRSHISL